jgi:Protein of unknown function (DUF3224)
MATRRVQGRFDVRLTPSGDATATPARMSVVKRFHGDLEAESRGTMLTSISPVEGSAGYVAIETVEGTLEGRHGSFVLQHSGLMDRGVPELRIVVVPDSGTEELRGLSGRLIVIVNGEEHRYDFEYSLPDDDPAGGSAPRLPRGNG